MPTLTDNLVDCAIIPAGTDQHVRYDDTYEPLPEAAGL